MPKEQQLHIILDNYPTHKHEEVLRWIERGERIFLHFIPTSSSWLNMVERFFRTLTDRQIRRGVFTSVKGARSALGRVHRHVQREPPAVRVDEISQADSWRKSGDSDSIGSIEFRTLDGMAMGKRPAARQASPMWVDTADLPTSDGHPFFERVNRVLEEAGFDAFVEGLCAAFYAARMGRPSLRPERYFRLLVIGYFEGLSSERGETTCRSARRRTGHRDAWVTASIGSRG